MIETLWRRWHRLFQRKLSPSPPLTPVTLLEDDPLVEEVRSTRPLLEKILEENILPFWLERALDREDGGFLLNHDGSGRWLGPCEKSTIPQARTCWFFSRLANAGFGEECASAARHGFEFLRQRLWDSEQDGFFWSVSHDGTSVADDSKRLYAVSFALYALAECATGGLHAQAPAFASEVARNLEDRFRDVQNGGFHSEFTRSWRLPDLSGPRGESTCQKTVNEHLHVLEALTGYARVGNDVWLRPRIVELILILTGTVLRKSAGASTDRHRGDWTPLLTPGNAAVSYGHDVESTWLVCEACRSAGLPVSLVADWCRSLLDFTLKWGRDRRSGGVYLAGPLDGPAHSRRKVWWVQAEVLVGALSAFRVTGDARYAELYLDTLEFIRSRHVDWEGGEWHAFVEPGGRSTGDKAGLWKSPYHNGRAMIQCIELLDPGDKARPVPVSGSGADIPPGPEYP